MILVIDPSLKAQLAPSHPFDQLMHLTGSVYRELENRKVQRVLIGSAYYFIKQHHGVGWKEIVKNIIQLRWPVLSAKNEWIALNYLKKLGILVPEPLAYGLYGRNPARMQSFLVTRELSNCITLEELGKQWSKKAPRFNEKQRLITEVAQIAHKLHQHGVNHRDFYLCHFLLQVTTQPDKSKPCLYLIDLHRAEIRKKTPQRWLIKDLAGLFFSSKKIGLTKRDLLRFIREYRKKSLRAILNQDAGFWHKVERRGNQLFQKETSRYFK